jgi:two-component system response regulator AtoC
LLEKGTQKKLCEVLSGQKLKRHGTNLLLNARFIFASEVNIETLVNKGKFNADLFHLIRGNEISIPPLNARAQDIPVMAQFLINHLNEIAGKSPKYLSSSALNKLAAYPFPGNYAELKSILQQAYAQTSSPMIEETHIAFANSPVHAKLHGREFSKEEHEHQLVVSLLKKYHGDVVLVANILEMGKTTLYTKLQKWGIKVRSKK